MTTIAPTELTCAVCDELSRQYVLGSTSTFGAPDLDTRPAELQRSTMWVWVQRCPSCGFCAPTLTKAPSEAAEIVRSDGYRAQLASR